MTDPFDDTIDRRTALKTTGMALSTGAALTLVGSAGAKHTCPDSGCGGSSYNELSSDEYIWKKSDYKAVVDDQTEHGGCCKYRGVLASSLMYLDVQKNPEGEYEHYFDAASSFTTYRKSMYDDEGYQKVDDVYRNKVTIDNHLPDSSFISANRRDDDVGAHPAPSDDSDNGSGWGDAAFTVLKATVSEINDKFNYAITAAEIGDALIVDGDATTDNSRKEFAWPYDSGDYEQEASTATRFMIENNDNASDIDFSFYHEGNSNADSAVNITIGWESRRTRLTTTEPVATRTDSADARSTPELLGHAVVATSFDGVASSRRASCVGERPASVLETRPGGGPLFVPSERSGRSAPYCSRGRPASTARSATSTSVPQVFRPARSATRSSASMSTRTSGPSRVTVAVVRSPAISSTSWPTASATSAAAVLSS
jgi:hypothetical protein